MMVGIISARGSGRDQFGRGKVLLLLRSGYIRFTDCSQIPGPFLSTVGYWPLSIPLKHQWSLLNLGLVPFVRAQLISELSSPVSISGFVLRCD
jgi:hypothetical protein